LLLIFKIIISIIPAAAPCNNSQRGQWVQQWYKYDDDDDDDDDDYYYDLGGEPSVPL
jgi:hypothetical protein